MVLLDAGASMCAPLRDQRKASTHESDRRRFDAAIAAVDNVLQQKVRWDPSDLRLLLGVLVAHEGLMWFDAAVLSAKGRDRHRGLWNGRFVMAS